MGRRGCAWAVLIGCLALVSCGDDDGSPTGPSDAGPPVDGGPHGTPVISEIRIGAYIELYNPTDETITIAPSALWLCVRPFYDSVSLFTDEETMAPGTYRTLLWPTALDGGMSEVTAAGGEMALYNNMSYSLASAMVDFVCWGTGKSGPTRSTEAGDGGQWSGDCAPAIADGEALHLTSLADRTRAAGYVSGAPSEGTGAL